MTLGREEGAWEYDGLQQPDTDAVKIAAKEGRNLFGFSGLCFSANAHKKVPTYLPRDSTITAFGCAAFGENLVRGPNGPLSVIKENHFLF